MAATDITGQRFGKLVVVSSFSGLDRRKLCRVRCDCGSITTMRSSALKRGVVTACKVRCAGRRLIHGMHKTRIYSVWRAMRHRCSSPKSHNWQRYGGRGIGVCEEWGDFRAFHSWALNNGYEVGLEIDRIDNDGNYEPSNCHFVTRRENNLNKSDTVFVSFRGESVPLAIAAERAGIKDSILRGRRRHGWSDERALSTPAKVTTCKDDPRCAR